jgi:hypothetical protein
MRTLVVTLLVAILFSSDRRERSAVAAAGERQDAETTGVPDLPHNIVFDERLKSVVTEMLGGSPTFRDQCRELGAVRRLRVRVTLDLDRQLNARRECRARCAIKRYEFGMIDADIRVLTIAQVQGLIAHELEHVREFVDGISYAVMAVRQPALAWVSAAGRFETARAIAAGEQVAREMARHRAAESRIIVARRAP